MCSSAAVFVIVAGQPTTDDDDDGGGDDPMVGQLARLKAEIVAELKAAQPTESLGN